MSEYLLNLENYIDTRLTALVGRKNGELLLGELKKAGIVLHDIEKINDIIKIEVPERILTINKSFFLGFLETRIQEIGVDNFNSKYLFIANDHIVRKIPVMVEYANLKSTQKEILDINE